MEARRVWRIAGEGRKGGALSRETAILVWSAVCLFLLGSATVAVTNVAETLFLKRVGVDLLPQVFLANSILLALSTFLVGRRAARADRGRLLTATLTALALGVLILWAATRSAVPGAMAALVVSSKQIQALGLLVFWVTLGGWLDGRQAKRLYPPIMAGGTLGMLAGSFASAPIGSALGIPALLLMAAAALGGAALATIALRRAAPARIEAPRPSRSRRPRRGISLAAIARQSGLFRLLAPATFLGGLLAPVLYYQFAAVADAATRGADGEQRLLALFSQFRGWLNLGVLLLQLVGTSWLFQRIGVPLASLVAPAVYVVGVLALGHDAALTVGVVAMAAATLQDHALQEPAERTLGTLFPERIRPTAAALIEGPVKRSGGVLGNVLVLVALALGGGAAVSLAAAPLALLWFVVVLALWRVYPTLLLEGARARRGGTALPLAELLDARTVRVLEAPLTDPDAQRCRAACALLREAGGSRVVLALARALAVAPAANRRLLLGTLAQLLEQGVPLTTDEGTQVRAALAHAIARPDGLDDLQRAGLVQGYARLGQGDEARSSDLLERCRGDFSPAVRLAAEIALAGARDGHLLAEAIHDPDLNLRRVAQQELRTELLLTSVNGNVDAAFEEHLGLLADLLEEPADRTVAAEILADVAARHGARALPAAPRFLTQRGSEDAAVRTALLRFVGHAGLTGEVRWAISRLNALTRDESRAAAESVTRLAPATMDVILEAVNSGSRRQRRALVPILRTVAVADQTLAALVASRARRGATRSEPRARPRLRTGLTARAPAPRRARGGSALVDSRAPRGSRGGAASRRARLLARARPGRPRPRGAPRGHGSLAAGRGERAAPRSPRRPGHGVGRERRGESRWAPARLRRGGARGPRG